MIKEKINQIHVHREIDKVQYAPEISICKKRGLLYFMQFKLFIYKYNMFFMADTLIIRKLEMMNEVY